MPMGFVMDVDREAFGSDMDEKYFSSTFCHCSSVFVSAHPRLVMDKLNCALLGIRQIRPLW